MGDGAGIVREHGAHGLLGIHLLALGHAHFAQVAVHGAVGAVAADDGRGIVWWIGAALTRLRPSWKNDEAVVALYPTYPVGPRAMGADRRRDELGTNVRGRLYYLQ